MMSETPAAGGQLVCRNVTPNLPFCRRVLRLGMAVLLLTRAALAIAADAASPTALPILQQLRNFATTGRVLHVAAHPDDENTQLIEYLARGRGFDTAYLSVTRGDGGQNILGPELDEKLGVARTQELLAARRIDGGRQFFTRAIDFGFTKTPEETLSIWDHQQVLGDVVRIYRRFRPDVVVTRFPIPPGSGGHGQHTASAILAVEAFRLAGDPKAYPEQLREGLQPWQPKRIVWNGSGFSRGGGLEKNPAVTVDVGGKDPVTGESFGIIAAQARAMHKTQNFGDFAGRGSGGARPEKFFLLGGEAATEDLMDGVDTTWNRVPGGAEIGAMAQAAVAHFNAASPAAIVPELLAIRRKLMLLERSVIVEDKRRELDRILTECLGVHVVSGAAQPNVVPGERIPITATVTAAPSVHLEWTGLEYAGQRVAVNKSVRAGNPETLSFTYETSPTTPLTQPYWLREAPSLGLYHVSDPHLIGVAENPPDLPLDYTLHVEDQSWIVHDRLTAKDGGPEQRRAVVVVPPVSVAFVSDVSIFRPGASRSVGVVVTANRPAASGKVRLATPEGWTATAPRTFALKQAGDTARLAFELRAPPTGGVVAALHAEAEVAGRTWNTETVRIEYPHIPPVLLQPAARERITSVDFATRGHRVGYLPGAGDDIPTALEQLGYEVVPLTGADVTREKLQGLDAVVLGVRVFNTRTDLVPHLPDLFAYVEQGGTVIAQYNRPGRDLKTEQIAPYPLKLSDNRITDENAAVTFLAPDHPALNVPNRITPADFSGWVQERGTYFPSQWDDHFVPLLSMHDPGEADQRDALLIARYGKGYYVYSSLAFFRQLPAGVPGAYRLFANLVSLGK